MPIQQGLENTQLSQVVSYCSEIEKMKKGFCPIPHLNAQQPYARSHSSCANNDTTNYYIIKHNLILRRGVHTGCQN